MSLRDVVRKYTPFTLLKWNRRRKKARQNIELRRQEETAKSYTKADLVETLKAIGIVKGDTLLVHSSLSKIGHLKEGPKTIVDALIEAIGFKGNLLMPTSPNNGFQLNYIRNTPLFDVLNTPSKTGKITEYFRTIPGAIRSLHPTEPVSAIGPKANFFLKDHFGQLTPYNVMSPFAKVSQERGKILYIGVTLLQAGTNLHTIEDAVDFKFPVYYPEIFEFKIIDSNGEEHVVKTKVHDPKWSKKRRCDDLIPMLEAERVLKRVKIGQAESFLMDADKFLSLMIEKYNSKGITMYTPRGS